MAAILNSAMLNFAILDSAHLSIYSQTHSHLPRSVPTISHIKNFTHSFWLNLMMAAILKFCHVRIQTLPSRIQTLCYHLSDSLKNTLTPIWLWLNTNSIWLYLIHSHLTWWWQPSWILPSWIRPFCTKLWLKLIQSDSKSFILSQLDDGSHLEFCLLAFNHLHKKNFTHSISLNLMMAAILNPTILDSPILHKTLTQTNSIWL